nr:immunoglobulin heavy chain junction region [Macaca mulatta]
CARRGRWYSGGWDYFDIW